MIRTVFQAVWQCEVVWRSIQKHLRVASSSEMTWSICSAPRSFPDIKWSMKTPSKQCQQCLRNVPALQNACTSTNISALFIFLPGKASEYKSTSAASILLLESNLTAASRPWADDRWWNVISGGKKEGKETMISHKNYFMFNIWLVSSQLLMWRSISKDWCALKLSIFVSEWNKWRICHHMDQLWLDTKPIRHMWGKRASICRWPFSSLLACAYTSVVFKGNRNEG